MPKMGWFAQVCFQFTRCFSCCGSRKALCELYKKTTEELEEELEILHMVKSLRKMNELNTKDDQFDEESTPQVNKSQVGRQKVRSNDNTLSVADSPPEDIMNLVEFGVESDADFNHEEDKKNEKITYSKA